MIRRVAVLAALTLTVATGCAEDAKEPAVAPSPSPSASPTASPIAAGPPWYDEVAPAAAGTTVGPEGSTCPLPITFSVPPKWKVKAVTSGKDFQIGPAVPLCEIDAKPAGHIGFLRVWRVEGATPRTPQVTLDKFIEDYGTAEERQYRRTKAGPLDSFEATWTGDDGRKRAILVSSLYGKMLVTLGGADDEEFTAMLPAYQLAKSSTNLPK
ncbi:lipoprotein [Micromonospora purpureochromogenes]|uniref:lipoprotein n=1 Tax=Micromonospora purpureochromogenes TaxID=47872 RepID=UPI003410B18E